MERSAPSPRTKKAQRSSLSRFLSFEPTRVKPQQIVLMCRQLASFVRVGIPVATALTTFADQATSSREREAYLAVVQDLERGGRLSDSFANHPRVFPSLVVDMVRSAEVTGNLDTVLRQAARHIEREASAKQKIKAAMIYPAIITSMAMLIAVGMVLFVLPRFGDLYTSLNVKPPTVLNAALGLSNFVTGHALLILAGVLAAVVGIGYAARTAKGRYVLDSVLLKLPLLTPLVKAATTERFCRTLGNMLEAGVPISHSFGVVVSNVSNRVYRRALGSVMPAMAAGKGISRPISATGVFNPAVVQMIRVGEETGNLTANLIETADMYEEELDFRIKKVTAIVEPAMIMFVGLLVGTVAVVMVTSIYSLAGGYK